MIDDPWFYAAAVPAVIMFGVSKGGFGAGFGFIAVPLIALVISPVQAAAILLPILCLMDIFALRAFRGKWVGPELRILVPPLLIGIGIGTWLFDSMSPAVIRLMLGAVAMAFSLHHWFQSHKSGARPRNFPLSVGVVAAATSGFR